MVDSIFGIGGPELLVILILAGIVMGPERIAQVARWLGKTTAQLQNISRGFAAQLQQELDGLDEDGGVKEAMDELRQLQREVQSLRKEVKHTADEFTAETRAAADESKAAVNNAIAPPQLAKPEKPHPGTNGTAGDDKLPEVPTDFELPNLADVPDDPE